MELVNLSCRGLVGAGPANLILGMSVGGAGQARLLLRGAGPALAGFGVGPTLAAPALTLYDASGRPIANNAGWAYSPQADQVAALGAAEGAFPFAPGSSDAALVALAGPGLYTASLSAAPPTVPGGVGLVEAYLAP